MTKKEKTQLAAIGGIIVVVLVVMVVYFRDHLLPKPTGAGDGVTVLERPDAPVNVDVSILNHPMYNRLKYYGPIEVVPTPISPGRATAPPADIGLEAEPADLEEADFEINTAPIPGAETGGGE